MYMYNAHVIVDVHVQALSTFLLHFILSFHVPSLKLLDFQVHKDSLTPAKVHV